MIAILVLAVLAYMVFGRRAVPCHDTPIVHITIQIKGDVHVHTDSRALPRTLDG